VPQEDVTAAETNPRVVFPMHGIMTRAEWQRAFTQVAANAGWRVRLNEWNFGRYSLAQFLWPFSKGGKLRWFSQTYSREVNDRRLGLDDDTRLPSIVAHSFGTYIVGYSMLRWSFLRFDKIILCGSILPVDFPWDLLIQRGQVRAIRNEIGAKDIWVRIVRYMVSHTGRSGADGFSRKHPRLEQPRFDFYEHSEFFSEGHMEEYWLPFLERVDSVLPVVDDVKVPPPRTFPPFGIHILFLVIMAALFSPITSQLWTPSPEKALDRLKERAKSGGGDIDKRDVEIVVNGRKIPEAVAIFTDGKAIPVKRRQFAVYLVQLDRLREAYSVCKEIPNKNEIRTVAAAALDKIRSDTRPDSEEWRFLCDVYGLLSDKGRNEIFATMTQPSREIIPRCVWENYAPRQ
jgi:hypothetical protein